MSNPVIDATGYRRNNCRLDPQAVSGNPATLLREFPALLARLSSGQAASVMPRPSCDQFRQNWAILVWARSGIGGGSADFCMSVTEL
jgi:hypothetical protein